MSVNCNITSLQKKKKWLNPYMCDFRNHRGGLYESGKFDVISSCRISETLEQFYPFRYRHLQ